jgi:hypothetical protein
MTCVKDMLTCQNLMMTCANGMLTCRIIVMTCAWYFDKLTCCLHKSCSYQACGLLFVTSYQVCAMTFSYHVLHIINVLCWNTKYAPCSLYQEICLVHTKPRMQANIDSAILMQKIGNCLVDNCLTADMKHFRFVDILPTNAWSTNIW